jgi:hypothetical protein
MEQDQNSDSYSDEEAKRRFEQALRGARVAGHKPMKDVAGKKPKRGKKSSTKSRQRKKQGGPAGKA